MSKLGSLSSSTSNRPGIFRGGFGRLVIAIGVVFIICAGIFSWLYINKNNKVSVPLTTENGVQIITPTAEPASLTIPSLGINAPFVQLNLNPNHTLEVPKGDKEVGWYIYSAKPGDIGPAVIVGHLDSPRGPAIFQNLKNIKTGEEIKIVRQDGSNVTYVVDTIENYSQDNFPTQKVYGSIEYAGIRLITCSGYFDTKKGHYSENLIVFGHLKN